MLFFLMRTHVGYYLLSLLTSTSVLPCRSLVRPTRSEVILPSLARCNVAPVGVSVQFTPYGTNKKGKLNYLSSPGVGSVQRAFCFTSVIKFFCPCLIMI